MEQDLVLTVDHDHAPSLSRALERLGVRPEPGAPILWAFAPQAPESDRDGSPVRFEADVPLGDDGVSARMTVRGLGAPERPGTTAKLIEVGLRVGEPLLEPARAFMKRLVAHFAEERRLECRGADHFLGSPTEVAWRKRSWPLWRIGAIHRALDAALAGWTRLRATSTRGKEPVRSSFFDDEGRRASLFTEVRYFLRRDDAWMVVDITVPGRTGLEVAIAAVGIPDDEIDGIHDRIEDGIRHCAVTRRRMTAYGEELRPEREFTWDELFLDPRVRDELRREVETFFARRELYLKMQLPHRRGLLLHGAPGTGKTLYGKILASTVKDAAFIWVTAADVVAGAMAIRDIFERARGCGRAVLFFEDLDFYASHRAGNGRDDTLGELLVQLDGMHSNDGLLVIATTNDLAAIEPALKDRPSRFDRTIEVGPAPEAMRLAHLERLLSPFGVGRELLAPLGERTDGLTGAQVQELALVARRRALERGAESVSARDLEAAIESARLFKVKAVGFAPVKRARSFAGCFGEDE